MNTPHPLMLRIKALGVPPKALFLLAGVKDSTGYLMLSGRHLSINTQLALEKVVALLESGTVCLICKRRGRGLKFVPLWRPDDAQGDPIAILQARVQELEQQLEEAQAIAASRVETPALPPVVFVHEGVEEAIRERDWWRARALTAEDELEAYQVAVL